METQLLEALGKIAGIGGIALGVFVLLFEEVIRKNIFPMLSDDHASGLIRQFMYLTFVVAVCGIGAWAYVAVKMPKPAVANETRALTEPQHGSTDIGGTWKALVKYSWGDTYPESSSSNDTGRISPAPRRTSRPPMVSSTGRSRKTA